MLVSLALAGAMLAQPQPTLMQQMGVNSTGRNGYEEYLMAADQMRRPGMREFIQWRTYLDSALRGTDAGTVPDVARPADLNGSLNLLQLKTASLRRLGNTLELVRRGNQKPVSNPFDQAIGEVTFPDLTEMRNLARLYSDAMYVYLSQGDHERAFDYYVQTKVMADNLANLSLIHMLVGSSMDGLGMQLMFNKRSTWSTADASSIIQSSELVLSRPPTLLRAVEGERTLAEKQIALTLAGPNTLKDLLASALEGDPDLARVLDRVSRLTPPEMNQVRQAAMNRFRQSHAALAEILALPEREWRAKVEADQTGPQNLRDVRTDSDLFAFAAELVATAVPAQAVDAVIIRRTQHRLLRLYAKATLYRWQNDRIPGKLDDFTVPADRIDPCSGGPFVFQRTGDETFEIYSNGTKETGRIDVLRRATATESMPAERLP